MPGLIRSGYKNPSLAFYSAKALRKHIVDFKSHFIQPDCVLKLIGFLSMEKIYPWEDFELHNVDGTITHEGPGPSSMPNARREY